MSLLLQELVTAQADRWPERAAVIWRRTTLGYHDLESRSNQLARALRAIGCRRGDRVCVSSLRSPDVAVALLGVCKADAIFVPLDASAPASHLARVIEASEPRCILTCANAAAGLDEAFALLHPSMAGTPVGSLGSSPTFGERYTTTFCLADLRHLPSRPLPYRNRASNPAMVLFQDGGAGRLKGVVLTHAGLRRFVLWANEYFGVVAGDRHLVHAALPADLASGAIVAGLAGGASLLVAPPDVVASPGRLADFVRENDVTLWLASTKVIGALAQLDLVAHSDFPAVRHVVWHREAPRPADLRHWIARLRHVKFTRLYGSPETTVVSHCYTVPARSESASAALPIGRPRPGVGVVVLDDDDRPTAPHAIGEIYVSGGGVSPGYWRDAESTRAAFVRHPHSDAAGSMFRTGDLGLVGDDGQIILAGTRGPVTAPGHDLFELREIEAALESLGSIRSAAVVASSNAGGERVLCCAYVPVSGLEILPADLRADLAAILPADLLPTRWRALDRLPQAPDGAIERSEIASWFSGGAGVLSTD